MEKFKVTGMTCAACSARVETAVSRVEGVESVSVNLLTGDMVCEGSAARDTIESAVIAAGYGIAASGSGGGFRAPEELKTRHGAMLFRLISSVVLLLPLMYLSMGHMLSLPVPAWVGAGENALMQMLLCIAVMVINQRFFVNGVKGALRLSPNMDTLVSLGAGVSFIASVPVLFAMLKGLGAGEDIEPLLMKLYFEAAAMILTLITLGKLLEELAKGRTVRSLRALMELTPKTAVLIRDGAEVEVPIGDVREGDIFVLRPGSRVPVDGEIISGEGALDESVLTGESMPQDKGVGEGVFGGTVNLSGYITARAKRVGEDTVISEIVRMVGNANATKAPIARLADRVSGYFVPAVLLLSLATFIGWVIADGDLTYAVGRAVSVVVISCPCALGLATPVAIMVGSGVGARRGILYKSARALEECGRIDAVVLDKTGTVTEGTPSVKAVYPIGISECELLALACSVEKGSEHPLARAVCQYALERPQGMDIPCAQGFKAMGGKGVFALVDGREVYGASLGYAREIAEIEQGVSDICDKTAREGSTPLLFIRDGRVVGVIAVADSPRCDAALGVSRLKELRVPVVMLTGDNETTARAIADAVGIEQVIAGVTPAQKESTVRALSEKYGRVMMVGDGVNDAPALASAAVGVAIGTGTDVAVESAEVVITGKRLTDVADCIRLGKRTLRIIKQNLFWAFIYNSVGIPLAAGLFGLTLAPAFGALAMSLSSFTVVMNALRINSFKSTPAALTAEAQKITEQKEKSEMKKIFKVEGMMCPHCEAHVKKAVEGVKGVTLAEASHKSAEVTVTYEGELDSAAVIKAIVEAGYTVK